MNEKNATPRWFVNAVVPRPDYTLQLEFASGESRVFDAKVLLDDPLFKPLRNLSLFMQAHRQGRSVVWNDEIDIAPEYLYEQSR